MIAPTQLKKLQPDLWEAADQLRVKAKLSAIEPHLMAATGSGK